MRRRSRWRWRKPGGEVRSLGQIPNRAESLRRLVKKLGPVALLRVCYEAGPTGYVVYWQLTALGVRCEVVAPTLVPVKAGRSGEDGSARRGEAGAQLPCGRLDAGVGPGCRAGGPARSGAGPGGREEGPVARAPPPREVPVAPRPTARGADDAVVAAASDVDRTGGAFEQAAQEATLAGLPATKSSTRRRGSRGWNGRSMRRF